MKTTQFKSAFILSGLVAVLALIVSVLGLFTGLYRDNPLVTAAWRGNDLVTLGVVVPILGLSLWLARRGSAAWLLIWCGSMVYMLYNYVFYVYGAFFNAAFPLYILLVALSLWALILSLPRLDADGLRRRFTPRTPVVWIAILMLLIPVIMGSIEILQLAGFYATGVVPEAITKTGHPTGVVYATDLAFLMPVIVVGAIWLLQRKAWGYILATVVMFKGVTYPLALVAMVIYSLAAGTGYDELLPFYLFFFVCSSIGLGLLIKNLPSGDQTGKAG